MNLPKAHKLYEESVKILKQNQHPNGGFYASPPGTRYPFIYPRDHSVAILGAISAGMLKQAKLGLEFILNAQKPVGEFSQRYDIEGNDASYKELQIDGTGLVLYSLGKYFKSSGGPFFDEMADRDFIEKHWSTVEKAVDFILANKNEEVDLVHTINSIHEFPAYEHGFEIYANSACCAGIFAAVEMGEAIGKDVSGWHDEAEKIKDAILTRLYSPRRRSFIKCIRVKDKSSKPIGYDSFASNVIDVDVVEHAPAYFGLIDENDIKNISTVKRIHENLWDKEIGGMNRYPELWNRNNGGYGPWCHFTCQMASHYVDVDNHDRAELYLSWVVDIAHNYHLPEHVSTIERFEMWLEDYTNASILRDSKLEMIKQAREHPKWKDGLAYITFPLIWAHAEYIRAYNNYSSKYL
ncbi:glucoamylase and related glycosyl hydrolase [Methanosalsum zhilinae DSM 4017]|uniref:Glucoamylase and related glycosyl hydrolase n=1 Tax=Methanosalsum zhilinae (strain DSM 4017 / NBRC 107636 / OCM 62 / WeN5) TaxID=679901 RepID=F7XM20_METZD|nr:glucoamylase [Methanosalsum zhilinae]AEH61209.1 glucoamylase and related glycosyl hydrolase [Methanosalsum zhilinae DSM 4017]